jgi:uncharacterized phiE125 gp8 family phage protein
MLTQVSRTYVEPVSLVEAKQHLKMDGITEDDVLITSLISQARMIAERETDRQILSRTWDYQLDEFPRDKLEIPISPILSIDSVKYIDGNGAEQTVPSSVYASYLGETSAHLYLKYNQEWPATRNQTAAVTVRFVTGYSEVPEQMKAAILLLVSDLYDSRSSTVVGSTVANASRTARSLLFSFRRMKA